MAPICQKKKKKKIHLHNSNQFTFANGEHGLEVQANPHRDDAGGRSTYLRSAVELAGRKKRTEIKTLEVKELQSTSLDIQLSTVGKRLRQVSGSSQTNRLYDADGRKGEDKSSCLT